MPSWNELLSEATKESTFDLVRRKYLKLLTEKTNRNVIIYYSGWLQKPILQRDPAVDLGINDSDKNGFMATIHNLDRDKGLDLLLHTPGGNMAATESLVEYLHQMFPNDIRAFIPQIAMSAGTMIACACAEIHMGKESSIGPIDPQMNTAAGSFPAHGIIEEFEQAAKEIKKDQSRMLVWSPILQKINPTTLSECAKASKWAKEMVEEWLASGMFASDADKEKKAKAVVKALTNGAQNKSHSRHIGYDKARDMGLNVHRLEDDDELQDAVLSVHHACVLTLTMTNAYKIIENQLGVAFIQQARIATVPAS